MAQKGVYSDLNLLYVTSVYTPCRRYAPATPTTSSVQELGKKTEVFRKIMYSISSPSVLTQLNQYD